MTQHAVEAEQLIELSYLQNLNNAYAEFFHYFKGSSLLIIKAPLNNAEIDLVGNDDDYQQLVDYILTLPNGCPMAPTILIRDRHCFNPALTPAVKTTIIDSLNSAN